MSRASTWPPGVWRLVAAALLAAAPVACNPIKNSCQDFPVSAGFEPVEPVRVDTEWPAATATDPLPQGLGPILHNPYSFGHYTSYARGYLHAPLAKVYLALHDPAASYLHNQDGATLRDRADDVGVESFPVSFAVHYKNNTSVGPSNVTTHFDVTYRAGPLSGTDAAPLVVGERYQKTCGVDKIEVMAGSLVATAVEGTTDVTSVEMVAWLQATTQGQSDCDGTLTDLFGDLAATVAALP